MNAPKVTPNCTWETGDAFGWTDKYVGETESEQQCIEIVMKETPSANGATWYNKTYCYAEIGANNVGPCKFASECQTCIFQGWLIDIIYNYTNYIKR